MRFPSLSITATLVFSLLLLSCSKIKIRLPSKQVSKTSITKEEEPKQALSPEKGLPPLEPLKENALPPTEKISPPPAEKKTDLSIVLNYFRYFHSLSDKELQAEGLRTQDEFKKDDSPIKLIRLAMLSGLSQTNGRDPKRALALLQIYLDMPNNSSAGLRDFSFLLSFVIKEYEGQARQIKKQAQQLTKEKKQNRDLKKIIEALKNIEQNIINKEQ